MVTKCLEINRKWLEKKAGKKGYQNKSVQLSIMLDSFWKYTEEETKNVPFKTPLEILQEEHK